MQNTQCPICQGKWSGQLYDAPTSRNGEKIECPTCGRYRISLEAIEDIFEGERPKVTDRIRALAAHLIYNEQKDARIPRLDSDWAERLVKEPKFPTPAQQATNAIRVIGDSVSRTGDTMQALPNNFFVQIGSPNPRFAFSVCKELYESGLVTGEPVEAMNAWGNFIDVSLSLRGWELHETERKGRFAGNYGFMALKFGESELDDLVKAVLKPSIKELGFELVDMRDLARAGIIDNIMRERIRDSAFVIADLTHNNPGAYWEAGYAEGLGKPVLYLCEHGKFELSKTHFDTNHCTTVTWGGDKTDDDFAAEIKATLRNSLGLFPTS